MCISATNSILLLIGVSSIIIILYDQRLYNLFRRSVHQTVDLFSPVTPPPQVDFTTLLLKGIALRCIVTR